MNMGQIVKTTDQKELGETSSKTKVSEGGASVKVPLENSFSSSQPLGNTVQPC